MKPPLNIGYNAVTDTVTIAGVTYSGDLFRAWGDGGLPIGTLFRIVRNKANGTVFGIELEKVVQREQDA